jgi:hypothetical protein
MRVTAIPDKATEQLFVFMTLSPDQVPVLFRFSQQFLQTFSDHMKL